jgi:hypothetical protein
VHFPLGSEKSLTALRAMLAMLAMLAIARVVSIRVFEKNGVAVN